MHATIMIQGTTSDAGKSIFATGLCRVLKRKGYRVAPFKPQNMALNSAVTIDGGEIGRAQAVQAQACGIPAQSDMNPVLLKPNSDCDAQVIIQGKALSNMDAKAFHNYKSRAMNAVLESYHRLNKEFDCIVVEGAGSPAEINLRDNDIANMGFAEAVDCNVVLIADIDRGGVFAHLLGTLEVLSQSEQQRIRGFIINRFRGDLALLKPGLEWLQQRTGKPVLGVLPYLQGLHIEAEDSIKLHRDTAVAADNDILRIVVPVLPRISNHTDFDALRQHPQVQLTFIGPADTIPACDLIILPGSKSVRDDLDWLKQQGWTSHIQKHLRYGGKLIGICGGFQILGQHIHDPEGVEGSAGSSCGLGLLDMQSTLSTDKTLTPTTGRLSLDDAAFTAYEIHCGISEGHALDKPLTDKSTGCRGAISEDNQILGCYLHGLFDHTEACTALLRWAGLTNPVSIDYQLLHEKEIDRLADAIETHIDIPALLDAMRQPT